MPSVPRSARRSPHLKRNNAAARAETVRVRVGDLVLPTWLPAAPEKNPMFLEKRVYQGSSGKVYPLPFTDRIAEKPVNRPWKAVWLENEFLRVLVLPELGGRVHAILDKTNGYDLIYNQAVIKPALVGLAGPWLSGGIEFNWPQHHRPATFLPVNFEVERHANGSRTIWCSDHDPMCRMKGMHGICLHPGRAVVEIKVRAYNRTPFVQTFLWWANIATRVHEAYQSFFPPDVSYVADHARRSMSEYPLAKGFYYGVNYGERARCGTPSAEVPCQFVPPHCRQGKMPAPPTDNEANDAGGVACPIYPPNDLSFYANIPTPCSYMCMGSKEDFFGGYDYKAQAGMIHLANHHIAPGKKQWTWGNHEFGYAWDRNLTEPDGQGEYPPYIELMAGVYTDNQPDFSFLQPGETKAWSQYLYPIQRIGPAQHATLHAAVSLRRYSGSERVGHDAILLGVAVTGVYHNARIMLRAKQKTLASLRRDLSPAKPLIQRISFPHGVAEKDLHVCVMDANGSELIAYRPKERVKAEVPAPATEPPAPRDIASAEELFITGLHLEQYRHATRCPAPYWLEALRRDPGDARCHTALGRWHLQRGEFAVAEYRFCKAIERLTRRNANPCDGEAFYHLGLCLRYQLDSNPQSAAIDSRFESAYAAFYKATWNQAWTAAAYHALAEMDCRRGDWVNALDHLNQSLRSNADNTRARNLKVLVFRKQDESEEARSLLDETLQLDRLDWWARHLNGEQLACDLQTRLDIAHDYARAGLYAEAARLLKEAAPTRRGSALPDQSWGALPLVEYTLGWLHQQLGDAKAALKHFRTAATQPPDYCFPARLEELAILESAIQANPRDARAPYYLGNLLYDRRRHPEAIRLWEKSAKLDPRFSIVWRNLGIGYFNIRKQSAKARTAYERAFRENPKDARLLYERDQLWKRLGEKPARRLRELERHRKLVRLRDDLNLELCALYNQTGQPAKALALARSRNFQPWEGGEGGPLGQYARSLLALGRQALAGKNAAKAREGFEAALVAPRNLGEAKHLLANQNDIHFWVGCAYAELGQNAQAQKHWRAAADFKGDFREMSVRAFSEMTLYCALSLEKLHEKAKAKKLLRALLAYGKKLQRTEAKIDYFATSLPTMLLFDEDLQFRQETTGLFLQAQAHFGLGRRRLARDLLRRVLKRDPNHAFAVDLTAELC